MAEEKKEFKVVFTDGFLKDLQEMTADMTPEEQAEFESEMQEIVASMKDGTFIEKSQKLDMNKLREEEPELYEEILRREADCKDPGKN